MTVPVDRTDAAVSVDRWRVAARWVALAGIVAAVVTIRLVAPDDPDFAYALLASVAYLVPGVVLVARRDGHVVGWLLCLLALAMGFGFFSAAGVSAIAAGEAWLVWLLDVSEWSLGLGLVIVALVVGLVGSALSGDEDGVAWLPILVAFVAVPAAFMVAILRCATVQPATVSVWLRRSRHQGGDL